MGELFSKFFADRGTHLAAMIAYFALLSFVPLLFLALALLGFAGRADESSFLVTELNKAFPSSSVDGILKVVRSVQDNAATLGVIGAVFVGWTSLSLFSVLESAFNIVYGKPNRSFLHGKLIAVLLLVSSLVTLFVGLLVGSFGYEILKGFAEDFFANDYVAYGISVLISTVSVFVFLFAVYYLLTNEKLAVQGSASGHDRGDDRPRGELPVAAGVPPALEGRDRSPGLRRARAAARLALPDGERDRLRRRGQLVARPRAPPDGRPRGSNRACLSALRFTVMALGSPA